MNKVSILNLSYGNYVSLDDYMNLKQALNEIREYIHKNRKEYNNYVGAEKDWLYIQDKIILQIIDKYLGSDNQ